MVVFIGRSKALRECEYSPKAHSRSKRQTIAGKLRAIVDDLRSQGFTSVRTIATQLNERGEGHDLAG